MTNVAQYCTSAQQAFLSSARHKAARSGQVVSGELSAKLEGDVSLAVSFLHHIMTGSQKVVA